MLALNRKLLRDLWRIKGQGAAIGMVVAAGVSMFVMYLSNFESLRLTQSSYYDRYRFADIFASLKRAPSSLEARIAEIAGVAQVETRVVATVTLDVPGLAEPAVGRLISIPTRRAPILNDVFLRQGRFIEAGRPDEILASEAFASAHGFRPGDRLAAIINGRRRQLEIVGIVLSPEFVYNIRPGELIPDDRRYGVFWMEREALATAFDMKGGFNDVAIRLSRGASESDVIARLDRLIEPYGGLGAIPRSLQISHWYLDSELTQLQNFGMIIPAVFLAVAAFLLNIVLSRIIAVQREQIAALKALGYSNFEVGRHYLAWSLAIVAFGAAVGAGFGVWLGGHLAELYNQYFRFPVLHYRLPGNVVLTATAVSLAAGVLGAAGAVRKAVRLPPAEAMRPQSPAAYRASLLERLGLRRLFSQPLRMILRDLERRPVRAGVTVLGAAVSVAILVVGLFSLDSLDVLLDLQFNAAQRQDITVNFVEAVSSGAIHEIRRLPGVVQAEPLRAVAVRLRSGHRSRQVAIQGLEADARLNRVIDASFEQVHLPPEGMVLSSKLAEILGTQLGSSLTVEVLEGARPIREVVVADVVEDYMGTAAYMEINALRRMMREGRTLSGAFLKVDSASLDQLYRRLKGMPAVAAVNVKQAALESFNSTIAENIGLIIFFNVVFSGIIAFGVVYNAARVSLSEHSHELATMRVLGFTRAEISTILLGEFALLTLLAVPIGLALGYGLSALIVQVFDSELYRFPLVISSRTYAFAAATVLAAAFLSALVVRRRLDRLDLLSVLKATSRAE